MSKLTNGKDTLRYQNLSFKKKKEKKRKEKIQERPLCGLLANINSAAANMGQSVICVWDG